jgi:MFS family permease
VGAIVALLSGGAFVRDVHEGWRIMWYIIAALLTSSGLITFFFYNPPPRELQASLTFRQKCKALDTVGITILPVGLTVFVMGLTWYANPYSFATSHVLAPFITGLAILAAFVLYESLVKKDGLIHHGLFQNDRNFAISSFLIFIEGVAFFAANQFFPYEVSVLYETDPVRIALRFCIAFIANVLATVLYSIYCSHYRQIRYPAVVSYICFVIFYGKQNHKPCNSKANRAQLQWRRRTKTIPNRLGFTPSS